MYQQHDPGFVIVCKLLKIINIKLLMIMLKLREKEKFWIDISFLFSHNFPNKLIAQVFRSQV